MKAQQILAIYNETPTDSGYAQLYYKSFFLTHFHERVATGGKCPKDLPLSVRIFDVQGNFHDKRHEDLLMGVDVAIGCMAMYGKPDDDTFFFGLIYCVGSGPPHVQVHYIQLLPFTTVNEFNCQNRFLTTTKEFEDDSTEWEPVHDTIDIKYLQAIIKSKLGIGKLPGKFKNAIQ